MTAELLLKMNNEIGEAATWLHSSEIFLWVDIDNCILYEYCPLTQKVSRHLMDDKVTAILPTNAQHEVILAVKNKLIQYNLVTRKQKELLGIDVDKAGFRTNDGKVSPEGRIWLGIMHETNHYQTGVLYCINHDFIIRKVLDQQYIPNGIVWNNDGTKMYYADSGRACIEEYDYDILTGDIRYSKIAVQVDTEMGAPDGMTIDSNGMLWVAHWGGFGVYVWNPENGKLMDKISLPVPNVSSCTFGGVNKNILFITTACAGLNATEKKKISFKWQFIYNKNYCQSI